MAKYDPHHADDADTVETGQCLGRLFRVEQLAAISVQREAQQELAKLPCKMIIVIIRFHIFIPLRIIRFNVIYFIFFHTNYRYL